MSALALVFFFVATFAVFFTKEEKAFA